MERREFAKLFVGCLAFCFVPRLAYAVEMDRTVAFYARSSADKGLRYLRTQQGPDGSWEGDIGNTAMALRAFVTSYRRYTMNDGPFVSKPANWLIDTLDGLPSSEIANVSTPHLAEAVMALRVLNIAEGSHLIRQLQLVLAKRRPDVAKLGPVTLQLEIYQALTALSGNQTDETAAFRTFADDVISELQLPSGGFPGPDFTEALSMTYASAVSLGLALQNKRAKQTRAALDRAIEAFAIDANAMHQDEPVFFIFDAMQAALMRAERGATGGNMGEAKTWRDTLAYKLLETQADDGGWLPDRSMGDRVAATARAVNAINKSLPAG